MSIGSRFSGVMTSKPLVRDLSSGKRLVCLSRRSGHCPCFGSDSFNSKHFVSSACVTTLTAQRSPHLFTITARAPGTRGTKGTVGSFDSCSKNSPTIPCDLIGSGTITKGYSGPTPHCCRAPAGRPVILLNCIRRRLVLTRTMMEK